MSLLALTGGRVLAPTGDLVTGTLLVDGEKIRGISIAEDVPEHATRIDVSGCVVAPGFIDTHVHGSGGHNFMEGTSEALSIISKYMAQAGVTSCLATTTSAAPTDLAKALDAAAARRRQPIVGQVDVLGVHLEGPFINPQFRGVHVADQVRPADAQELADIYRIAGDALRVVTLAPEMPQGLAAVRFLAERGVHVSIGHTGATYTETQIAIANGVCRGTHVFNAMPPIHHRDPGPVIALMEAQDTYLEFIIDGHHVHPAVIASAIRQIGSGRIVLITDSTDVAGLEDGVHTRWEGTEVILANGESRTSSGALAGSVLRMDQGVRNLVERVGVPLPVALRMASENPARSIGAFSRKGSFAPGKDADIVVLQPDLCVLSTIIRGQIVYDARH